MIDFVLNVVGFFASFLNSLLPESPFQSLITTTQIFSTGLGWLNWVCPIGSMCALFAAWLAACIAAVVARILWIKASGAVGILTGTSGGKVLT